MDPVSSDEAGSEDVCSACSSAGAAKKVRRN